MPGSAAKRISRHLKQQIMCKLMDSPVFHLDRFRELYTAADDVIVYKRGGTLNYSFPSFEAAYNAFKEFDLIIYENELVLNREFQSGALNFIITLKTRK